MNYLPMGTGMTIYADFQVNITTLLHDIPPDSCRIAWSFDGSILALATGRRTVIVAQAGKPELFLEHDDDDIFALAFSPNKQILAVAGSNGHIYQWDLQDPKNITREIIYESDDDRDVRSLVWSPNGKLIAFGGDDRTLRVLNTTSNKIFSKRFAKKRISSLAWCPNEEVFVVALASQDGNLYLIDLAKETVILQVPFQQPIYSMAWSPQGQYIAVGLRNGMSVLLQFSGKSLKKLVTKANFEIDNADTRVTSLAFNPTSSYLISRSSTGDVCIHNIKTEEILIKRRVSTASIWDVGIGVHPSKDKIALIHANKLLIWDLYDDSPTHQHISYRGAKVAVLGGRQSGKSSLVNSLADVSQGNQKAQLDKLRIVPAPARHILQDYQHTIVHQLYLWDFGSHDGYRLVQELFLHDVDVVLLTHNYEDVGQFSAIEYWLNIIHKIEEHKNSSIKVILVITHHDEFEDMINMPYLKSLPQSLGLDDVVVTSSKSGYGIKETANKIYDHAAWDRLATTKSFEQFEDVKDCIDRVREKTRIISKYDLYQQIFDAMDYHISTASLNNIVALMHHVGLIFDFDFKDYILLDTVSAESYAIELFEKARSERRIETGTLSDKRSGFGIINEDEIISELNPLQRGKKDHQKSIILNCVINLLLTNDLILRDQGMLIFLNQYKFPSPVDLKTLDKSLVFEIEEPMSTCLSYITLTLHRSEEFGRAVYWSNAVRFQSGDKIYEIYHNRCHERLNEVWLHCSGTVTQREQAVFETYVHSLLVEYFGTNSSISVRRHYICDRCGVPFSPDQVKLFSQRSYLECPIPSCKSRKKTIEFQSASPNTLEIDHIVGNLKLKAIEKQKRDIADYQLLASKILHKFDVFVVFLDSYASQIQTIYKYFNNLGIYTWLRPIAKNSTDYLEDFQDFLSKVYRVIVFTHPNDEEWNAKILEDLYDHCGANHIIIKASLSLPQAKANRGWINANTFTFMDVRNEKEISEFADVVKSSKTLNYYDDITSRLHSVRLQIYPDFGLQILEHIGAQAFEPFKWGNIEYGRLWYGTFSLPGINIDGNPFLIYFRSDNQQSEALISDIVNQADVEYLLVIDTLQLPQMDTGRIDTVIPVLYLDLNLLINLLKAENKSGWLSRFIIRSRDEYEISGYIPYSPRDAATDSAFYGRSQELQALIRTKSLGGIILGPYRSGKTSFLRKIQESLPIEHYSVVFLSLGAGNIASFLEGSLNELKIRIPDKLTPKVWSDALRRYSERTHKLPVLLLDEIDLLILEDEKTGYEIASEMNFLVAENKCLFFLSGHLYLRKAIMEGGRYYLRVRNKPMYLRGLYQDEAFSLLNQPMRRMGFEFDRMQLQRIYEGTGGIPYLINWFCHTLLGKLEPIPDLINSEKITEDEILKVEQDSSYLSYVYEYYLYDRSPIRNSLIQYIYLTPNSTRTDLFRFLTGMGIKHSVELCIAELNPLIEDYQFIAEDTQTGYLSLIPIYLSYALKKQAISDITLQQSIKQFLDD